MHNQIMRWLLSTMLPSVVFSNNNDPLEDLRRLGGDCWSQLEEEALEAFGETACDLLTSTEKTVIVMRLTVCYFRNRIHSEDCFPKRTFDTERLRRCAFQLPPDTFPVFSQLSNHADNVCFYLRSGRRREASDMIMAALSEAVDDAATALQRTTALQQSQLTIHQRLLTQIESHKVSTLSEVGRLQAVAERVTWMGEQAHDLVRLLEAQILLLRGSVRSGLFHVAMGALLWVLRGACGELAPHFYIAWIRLLAFEYLLYNLRRCLEDNVVEPDLDDALRFLTWTGRLFGVCWALSRVSVARSLQRDNERRVERTCRHMRACAASIRARSCGLKRMIREASSRPVSRRVVTSSRRSAGCAPKEGRGDENAHPRRGC
ncbi:MAG: uncharacterized protein KVP18_004200 [Porospora cf. gigantea A]|uniref:uncharacterized protein n=1 Tax=Porospora cf. gigantea A TaxID=2853593 RepID=UPI00355993B2|nr:MAG: hypothetical protein KVP18_004200 [Porospora cf. gigantea A]